jgi:hypothetical protein
VGVAVLAMLFSVLHEAVVQRDGYFYQDWRGAVALVQRFYQPGDGVVFIGPYCELPFRRYFPHDDLQQIPILGLPYSYPKRLRDVSSETHVKLRGYANKIEALQTLEAFASGRQRLWVVLCHAATLEFQNFATTWLKMNSSAMSSTSYQQVRVNLFELRPAGSASQ